MMKEITSYDARKAALSEQMRAASDVRLGKETSNLFRVREKDTAARTLSVRDFNHVLSVNAHEGWADVEGMTTYEDLVNETLRHGMMPAVVPQLKTITIGGAVAGLGIESSSFRYGLAHETVLAMEILLASGETVVCDKDNNADLFYGFPNSYGTLGYALRLTIKLIPVKPFVKIEHTRYADTASYFEALKVASATEDGKGGIDFVDGTIFSEKEMYITTGTFVEQAPYASDYTYKKIYYRSIRERKEDYLSVHDYLWRWDTDWFWCSKVIYAQNPVVRRLLGRQRLTSKFYGALMRWDRRTRFGEKISSLFGIKKEWIIQDVDIPIENAPAFASFFFENIAIRPIWICPFSAYQKSTKFTLCSLDPQKTYVNFGFWDSVPAHSEKGYYNRLVEDTVLKLGGKKGLYSDSFYTPEAFWKIYDKAAYETLKRKYDPTRKLKGLYEKCVQKA